MIKCITLNIKYDENYILIFKWITIKLSSKITKLNWFLAIFTLNEDIIA